MKLAPSFVFADLSVETFHIQMAEPYWLYLQRNRERLRSSSPKFEFSSASDCEELIRRREQQMNEGHALHFALRLGNDLLGTIGYTSISHGPLQSCFLGYGIDASLEGKGVMFELLKLTNAWIFEELNLHRIQANHRPENLRSARLLERLGFEREGYARDYLFLDGAWRDHVLTSLIRKA